MPLLEGGAEPEGLLDCGGAEGVRLLDGGGEADRESGVLLLEGGAEPEGLLDGGGAERDLEDGDGDFCGDGDGSGVGSGGGARAMTSFIPRFISEALRALLLYRATISRR